MFTETKQTQIKLSRGPPKATQKLLTSKRILFLEQTDGTVYNTAKNRLFITCIDGHKFLKFRCFLIKK